MIFSKGLYDSKELMVDLMKRIEKPAWMYFWVIISFSLSNESQILDALCSNLHEFASWWVSNESLVFDALCSNLNELKLRPIMDQTGTFYYQAAKIVAEYL